MKELFGLINTQLHPIPLLGVKVNGYLLGRGAKITIHQRFCNQERNAVEAVYKFPLPENSAVTGFKVWRGENMIQSMIEEREKAFEMYDKALEQGHGAYLLDEERPNIFTLSVGNLNPGMDVIIEINLVMLLDMEGSKYRFTLPTAISPRYVPDDIPSDNGIPVSDIIHPEYAESVPYGLSLTLQILNRVKVSTIESPSHPIKINLNKETIKVELINDSVQMDRDFILIIDPADTANTIAYRYDEDKYSYWQLDFTLPPTKFPKVNTVKEIIFMLDCSGSMQGQSIQEAKSALKICLKALPQNCNFNIYRFGSTYNSFFKLSSNYSEKSLNDALYLLEKTDANMGGTEIYAPLKDILESPSTSCDKIVILITDGEVGNEKQLFNLVIENKNNLRLFSIGIGAGPNEYLIKGLARLGNGASEFIYPGERIESKVIRLFSRINTPRLDLKNISWNVEEIEQAPTNPIIFADSMITIFARSKFQNRKINKLPIKVDIGTEIIEFNSEIINAAPESIPIPILWAREMLKDLEYSYKLSESQQRSRIEYKNKNKIIELSKAYNIISQYTSFVGVEERKEADKTTGEVKLRKVPTLITNGWHGMRQLFVISNKISPKKVYSIDLSCEEISPMHIIKNDKSDLLSDILLTQQINGGFYIDDILARKLNLDLKKLKTLANSILTKIQVDTFILLCTVIVFEVLKTLVNVQKNVWQVLTEKSTMWLDNILKQDKPLIDGKELTDWVKDFVKNEVKLDSD